MVDKGSQNSRLKYSEHAKCIRRNSQDNWPLQSVKHVAFNGNLCDRLVRVVQNVLKKCNPVAKHSWYANNAGLN